MPDTYREASLALGASKSQTIARVVLPCALPGMLTGAILGVARAAGRDRGDHVHRRGLLYTQVAGFPFQRGHGSALPHVCAGHCGHGYRKDPPLQYGTGLVLVLLVLGMNLAAVILRDRLQRQR